MAIDSGFSSDLAQSALTYVDVVEQGRQAVGTSVFGGQVEEGEPVLASGEGAHAARTVLLRLRHEILHHTHSTFAAFTHFQEDA